MFLVIRHQLYPQVTFLLNVIITIQQQLVYDLMPVQALVTLTLI